MAFCDEMVVMALEMMLMNNCAPPFVAYENLARNTRHVWLRDCKGRS